MLRDVLLTLLLGGRQFDLDSIDSVDAIDEQDQDEDEGNLRIHQQGFVARYIPYTDLHAIL